MIGEFEKLFHAEIWYGVAFCDLGDLPGIKLDIALKPRCTFMYITSQECIDEHEGGGIMLKELTQSYAGKRAFFA